jgi:hypothetical protein
MYVKGLLICWLHNIIILFDKLWYPDEFLEFSEETVLSNSASVIGIITIFGKPLGRVLFRNDIAELMPI